MIPIKNKKKSLEVTVDEMRNFSFNYIEKYAPSKQQLKTYLLKKYLTKFQGSRQRKEVTEIIDNIVSNLEKSHFLNDSLYSDSKARTLFRRGYSLNKIGNSLRYKGIEQKKIQASLEKIRSEKTDPDFTSAMKICKKRRIGPMRPEGNREIFYKKDMGILARGGFSFDLSKRVLNLDLDEFNKLLKIV